MLDFFGLQVHDIYLLLLECVLGDDAVESVCIMKDSHLLCVHVLHPDGAHGLAPKREALTVGPQNA